MSQDKKRKCNAKEKDPDPSGRVGDMIRDLLNLVNTENVTAHYSKFSELRRTIEQIQSDIKDSELLHLAASEKKEISEETPDQFQERALKTDEWVYIDNGYVLGDWDRYESTCCGLHHVKYSFPEAVRMYRLRGAWGYYVCRSCINCPHFKSTVRKIVYLEFGENPRYKLYD